MKNLLKQHKMKPNKKESKRYIKDVLDGFHFWHDWKFLILFLIDASNQLLLWQKDGVLFFQTINVENKSANKNIPPLK